MVQPLFPIGLAKVPLLAKEDNDVSQGTSWGRLAYAPAIIAGGIVIVSLDWWVVYEEPDLWDVIPEFTIGFYNHRLIWSWPLSMVHYTTRENAGTWICDRGWWS